MNLAGKIFAVICMIAAVFYAGITAALMSLQENYKQKWADEAKLHEKTKDDWKKNREDLEGRLKQLAGEYARLEKRSNELAGEVNELRAEWAAAAGINRLAMAVINDQEDQIAALNARVDRYNEDLKAQRDENAKLAAARDDWKTKHEELLKNRDALQDLLTVRENELTKAVKELGRVNADLEMANDLLLRLKEHDPPLYKELVSGRVGQALKPPLIRGKVTGVDKSLGLVIINVGQRHEVRKGYPFIVFRGDKYVGRVVVDEVFPDMAASHYDRQYMKEDVEVGDDVATRLEIEL